MGNFFKYRNDHEGRSRRVQEYLDMFNSEYSKRSPNMKVLEDILYSITYFNEGISIQANPDQDFLREQQIIENIENPYSNRAKQDLHSKPSRLFGAPNIETHKSPIITTALPNPQRFTQQHSIETPKTKAKIYFQPKAPEKTPERSYLFDPSFNLSNEPKKQSPPEIPNFQSSPISSIKSNKPLCINCKLTQSITTECPHWLCYNCLQESYQKISNNSYLGRMLCETCKTPISVEKHLNMEMLLEYRERSIQRLQEKFINNALESSFQCPICSEELIVSESFTFACNHRICSECVNELMTEAIKSSNLKGLVCPQCSESATYEEIKANVDLDTFELYLVLTTRRHRPDSFNYYLKECFICKSFLEVLKTAKDFKCPGCNTTYCPQCNNNHPGISCKENQEKAGNTFKNIEHVECPKCHEAIILDEKGCNFVKCGWNGCLETFCALCHLSFPPSKHFSHYTKVGPFGKTCNTIDNLPTN